ncbi:MAG: glycosyltransferase [Thermoanaerobaculia bacterium]|nr:glycosyltransferase [Thermoanaerobaculia bacterium]
MNRRLLFVSPHFPPDTTAGTHRARLLVPHLPAHGWDVTLLTVDPSGYEGRLDPDLATLNPSAPRTVRVQPLPVRWTRPLGLGDLGLRALPSLARTGARLLEHEPHDAVLITIYPTYPAILGPRWRRRFGVPFVLDYQDPWVGAWGSTTGPAGHVDWKSRATRRVAEWLEPRVLRSADGLTAVSAATLDEALARSPGLLRPPTLELPIGGESADFAVLAERPRPNPWFDPNDGCLHLVYAGTLLPLGFETLRALLRAVAELRDRDPELAARLRLHFFGTSNQTTTNAAPRVLPLATELGVVDWVTEHPPRLDYLDALTVQTQATALLLLGSSERHYTASKLYPALLARRPVLALYHEASTVVATLRRAARPPSVRLVTYDDETRAGDRVAAITAELAALAAAPRYDPATVDLSVLEEFSALRLAGRLGAFLDEIVRRGLSRRT